MRKSGTLLAILIVLPILTNSALAGNTIESAYPIPSSGTIGGPLGDGERIWYAFDAAYGECWEFSIPEMPVGFAVQIFAADRGKIEKVAGPLSEPGYIQHKFENAGTYHLMIEGKAGSVFYSLNASSVLCDPNERNEICGTGPFLEKGEPVEASIGSQGDQDWYRFEVDEPVCLTFATGPTPGEAYPALTLWVLNTSGGCGGGGAGAAGGAAGTRMTCFFTEPGTYYVRVGRNPARPEPDLGFYNLVMEECPAEGETPAWVAP